jgi:hypothetical protein
LAAQAEGLSALTAQFVAATQSREGAIDWEVAERQLAAPSGIPLTIGRSIKNAATSAAFE